MKTPTSLNLPEVMKDWNASSAVMRRVGKERAVCKVAMICETKHKSRQGRFDARLIDEREGTHLRRESRDTGTDFESKSRQTSNNLLLLSNRSVRF